MKTEFNRPMDSPDPNWVYHVPRNMLFLGGMAYSNKESLLSELEQSKEFPWLNAVPSVKLTLHCDSITNSSVSADLKSLEHDEFTKQNMKIAELSINVYNICRKAYANPDILFVSTSCPMDLSLTFHALRDLKLLGDDEHYLLCDILRVAFSPLLLPEFRTIFIYPDLFTILNRIPEEEKNSKQDFYETLHLIYNTYLLRGDMQQYMPYCKWIQTSKDQLTPLKEYIKEYYNMYIEYKASNPPPKLVHPAVTKDRDFSKETEQKNTEPSNRFGCSS